MREPSDLPCPLTPWSIASGRSACLGGHSSQLEKTTSFLDANPFGSTQEDFRHAKGKRCRSFYDDVTIENYDRELLANKSLHESTPPTETRDNENETTLDVDSLKIIDKYGVQSNNSLLDERDKKDFTKTMDVRTDDGDRGNKELSRSLGNNEEKLIRCRERLSCLILPTQTEEIPQPPTNFSENPNVTESENVDLAEPQCLPSPIPDIISDHVRPPATSSRACNASTSNGVAADTPASPAAGEGSGSDERNVSRSSGDDVDAEDVADLNSRRAVLRGHSIRISHTVHPRHQSRLPSIADPTAAPPLAPSSSGPSYSPQNHLLKGWESRIDVHGRIFYIDHVNRRTTWTKPEAAPAARNSAISEEEWRNMDRRYQSLRRSTGLADRGDDANRTPTILGWQSSPTNQNNPVLNQQKFGEPVLPGAVFLCRPDFFSLLQNHNVALDEYSQNSALKHMVNKIRRDYSSFQQLQHRKDLVAFLNHFAEPNRPFPNKWEMKMDKSNKPYYIDHSSKATTYIDPRFPPMPQMHADVLRGNGRRYSTSVQEGSEGQVEYHDRVVSFLRQSDILDILKTKYPGILSSMSLKNKVNMIRSEGQQAILKLKNDVELTVMLSVFEEEIMTYVLPDAELQFGGAKPSPQASHHRSVQKKRNLDLKLNEFYARLEDRGFCKGSVKYRLIVRRDRILQDGYDKVMNLTKKDLQKSKLVIAFKDEDGLDYGGPSREFFFLLSRELFNPYYGLFAYSANDTYTVQVSPTSNQIENCLGWFRFAGRIIALALVHQYLLDVFFTRVFYKQLLHLKPCLSDLESLDLEFYQSLVWIQDKATPEELESMCLTFSVTEEVEEEDDAAIPDDDADYGKDARKGFLGWFDGIVKGKTLTEQDRRRSKSIPRINSPTTSSASTPSGRNVASTSYTGSSLNVTSPRHSSYIAGSSFNLGSDRSEPPSATTSSRSTPMSRSNKTLSMLNLNAETRAKEFPLDKAGSGLKGLASGKSQMALATTKALGPKIIERELKPNGRCIGVTERNKKEYVERMINWRVKRGTRRPMEALIHGFNEILEPRLVSKFDAHELELVIAGSIEIDIQDWRANTVYRSGYTDNHQVIVWFWNVVSTYDNNQRLRLLQFVTGTSSIPVEGFSALRGSTGPKKFCIEKWGKVTDLPRAHTCFNRVDLPPYTSYGVLLEKLTIAVEETSTFGIE